MSLMKSMSSSTPKTSKSQARRHSSRRSLNVNFSPSPLRMASKSPARRENAAASYSSRDSSLEQSGRKTQPNRSSRGSNARSQKTKTQHSTPALLNYRRDRWNAMIADLEAKHGIPEEICPREDSTGLRASHQRNRRSKAKSSTPKAKQAVRRSRQSGRNQSKSKRMVLREKAVSGKRNCSC